METGYYFIFLMMLVGGLFVALGYPLKLGRVPPNRFYGFRTPRTLTNERIWYEVNRVTGIDMIRGGVVIIAASLIMLALRGIIGSDMAVVILLGIAIAVAAYMAIHGLLVLRKMPSTG
jgi:uncharacterized membrane protein